MRGMKNEEGMCDVKLNREGRGRGEKAIKGNGVG